MYEWSGMTKFILKCNQNQFKCQYVTLLKKSWVRPCKRQRELIIKRPFVSVGDVDAVVSLGGTPGSPRLVPDIPMFYDYFHVCTGRLFLHKKNWPTNGRLSRLVASDSADRFHGHIRYRRWAHAVAFNRWNCTCKSQRWYYIFDLHYLDCKLLVWIDILKQDKDRKHCRRIFYTNIVLGFNVEIDFI